MMVSTEYLCVHNSFEKHYLGAILLIPLPIALHFVFSMTISFLQCFSHIIATLILDSGISHLYVPMYCTFWLVVQLRYAVLSGWLSTTLSCRLELQLPRVRVGVFIGTAKIECVSLATLQLYWSANSSRCYGSLPLQKHPREEIILILSCFSADN